MVRRETRRRLVRAHETAAARALPPGKRQHDAALEIDDGRKDFLFAFDLQGKEAVVTIDRVIAGERSAASRVARRRSRSLRSSAKKKLPHHRRTARRSRRCTETTHSGVVRQVDHAAKSTTTTFGGRPWNASACVRRCRVRLAVGSAARPSRIVPGGRGVGSRRGAVVIEPIRFGAEGDGEVAGALPLSCRGRRRRDGRDAQGTALHLYLLGGRDVVVYDGGVCRVRPGTSSALQTRTRRS